MSFWIAADESLAREEQEDLIEQLNERIENLENDARRYRVVPSELEAYAQEVARLRTSLEETNRPGINPEDRWRGAETPTRRVREPRIIDIAAMPRDSEGQSSACLPHVAGVPRRSTETVLCEHDSVLVTSDSYVHDPVTLSSNRAEICG